MICRDGHGVDVPHTLCSLEQRACRSLLDGIYGDNALWLRPEGSPSAPACPLIGSMLDLAIAADAVAAPLRALATALPVQSCSQRLVVAQHVTETSADPEALVDELVRVLLPEGILLLLALNPFSPGAWWQRRCWQGAGHPVSALRRPAGYWHGRLQRGGIETLLVRHLGPLLPGRAALQRERSELGGNILRPVFVLLARKTFVQAISLRTRFRRHLPEMQGQWLGGMSPGRVGPQHRDGAAGPEVRP